MPTLNDALQLRTLWNASAELLMQRILQLDTMSERLEQKLAYLGTVEQWMSFIQYLAIERNAAWVRYDLEHKTAWDASGFFR
jgi:hypothetical protein